LPIKVNRTFVMMITRDRNSFDRNHEIDDDEWNVGKNMRESFSSFISCWC
jgi:hypothetical protein